MTHGARTTSRTTHPRGPARIGGLLATVAGVALLAAAGMVAASSSAGAATAKVDLGTAGSYSVLAGQTVTNTTTPGAPTTHLGGSLGLSPGTSITGIVPSMVGGATDVGPTSPAATAQTNLTAAYGDAAGRSPTGGLLGSALVGKTLTSGVYKATTSLNLSGPLTLDGKGDPNAVFIFQIGSTLVTDSASSVVVSNGAQACNVFWQVGSSATLGTNSTFKGTIMALASVTVTTGATVQGQALASTGSVTLDHNVFSAPGCASTQAAASAAASAYRSSAAASSAAAARSLAAAAVPSSSPATPSRSATTTELAATGPKTPSGPLLLLGLGLLAVGGLLIVAGRNRSSGGTYS